MRQRSSTRGKHAGSSLRNARREGCLRCGAGPALLLLVLGQAARADVNSSGDVSPVFAPAATVDLSGRQIYIGSSPNGSGLSGTLNVTNGGVLTAAQLVPGLGGLGTGVVNVTGAGSTVRLTGGAAFNGLDIGSWGTGTVTVANGGAIVCASVTACAFNNIANAAGSTGTLVINGGSVTGLGQLAIAAGNVSSGFGTAGASTSGTLTIRGGGTLTTTGPNNVANNSGLTGAVTGVATIDGAGSSWTITRDLAGGRGQANLNVGRSANSSGTMTVSNGGLLTIVGSRADPATDNSVPALQVGVNAGATGTMTVTTGGAVRIGGDTGVVNVGGTINGTGGNGTLNITAGGSVAGADANSLTFVGIGRSGGGSGVVSVSGTGSLLAVSGVGGTNTQGLDGVGGLVLVGSTGSNSGALSVANGAAVTISDGGRTTTASGPGLRLADGASSATVTVTGAGSSIVVSSTSGSTATTPYVLIGNGGTAQMTISNGASVSVLGTGQRDFTVNNAGTGFGALTATSGASIVASRFAVADDGGTAVATLDNASVRLDGVINFNGGLIGAGVRVGRGDGADGTLTMRNGATIQIDNTAANASVNLGGTSTLPGGTGRLVMSSGSTIAFTGAAAGATVFVGSTAGTGIMTMTGASTVNAGATGTISVGGAAGTTGTLSVGSGSTVTANVINIGGNSDTAAGGTGTATVTGAGSALVASGGTGLVTVGRNGTGSLALSDQANLSAISTSIGRGAFGTGTLTVDHATVTVAGQQTTGTAPIGANLAIGIAGGLGTASISNGSVVSISNSGSLGASLDVGGRPESPGALGTGTLTVTGSQVNVTAAPGQATVRIGYDGTGTATLTGSQLTVGNAIAGSADGRLLIAERPGSSGTLSLNAGSVVNAGDVGVGTSASGAGAGGAATLVVNNSSVNAQTFELGTNGVLTGNGGVLTIAGDATFAGTISPGNSPGSLRINCNIVTLPGSGLVLEVLATSDGYSIDHLLIGNDSTFDLHNLDIEFHFLGNTDPNAFIASGGLDLDNFLQAYDLSNGAVSGLSTLFAPGRNWLDVVDPAKVSATSSAYVLSDFRLSSDGSVAARAVPSIPEPSTWALFAVGLIALGTAARRRAKRLT